MSTNVLSNSNTDIINDFIRKKSLTRLDILKKDLKLVTCSCDFVNDNDSDYNILFKLELR